jgi:hypothetical protein
MFHLLAARITTFLLARRDQDDRGSAIEAVILVLASIAITAAVVAAMWKAVGSRIEQIK